jgi:hypothetical protein
MRKNLLFLNKKKQKDFYQGPHGKSPKLPHSCANDGFSPMAQAPTSTLSRARPQLRRPKAARRAKAAWT